MIHQLQLFKPQEVEKKITVPPTASRMLFNSDCRIIIAFSGGKDSVAIVLYILELGVDKNRLELHHHLVDGKGENLFDWKCTESYCKAFAKAFNIPITFSWRVGGIEREIYRKNEGVQSVQFDCATSESGVRTLSSKIGNSTRYKFPAVSASLQTRWCSGAVKISVFSRYINNTTVKADILFLTGERRAESQARSKYKSEQAHSSKTKNRNIWHWRPVIDFTERRIWDLYKKYGVQPHPAYELGWGRCSCQLCIFSSANTWASINNLSPEKVDRIEAIEKEINHTLYNRMTIRQMVKKGKSFLRPEMIKRWKSEILGEFISPIFIKNWKLPQGAFANEASGSL